VKRTRVLLVDDDEGIRLALGSLLRASEFEIAGEAADGYTALAAAACLRPEVILLDLAMPRLNGLEALPGLRDCLPSAAIIVLTNHENPTYRDEALRLGADAFVPKLRAPFDLIPVIKALLTARQPGTFPEDQ
jgi:DNA-binding NarL/FixJ family response regulator